MVNGQALARRSIFINVTSRITEGSFAVQGALLASNQFMVRDLYRASRAESTVRSGRVRIDRARRRTYVLRTGSEGGR